MRLGTLLLVLGLWLYPLPRVHLDPRAGDPPCADRYRAAVSVHYLTHVPPLRPARAGHHDGSGPDLRRAGARGGPAPRDGGLPAPRPCLAVLPGGRLRRSSWALLAFQMTGRSRRLPTGDVRPDGEARASRAHEQRTSGWRRLERSGGGSWRRWCVRRRDAVERKDRRRRRQPLRPLHCDRRSPRPAAPPPRPPSSPRSARQPDRPSSGSASAACWPSASSRC